MINLLVFLTDAEVLVLQQRRDLRLQRDGVAQQDVLPRHLTLVAVVEAEPEAAVAGVLHNPARVEVAVGRPLGNDAQTDEASAGRQRRIRRRAQGVGAAGRVGVRRAGGEPRRQRAGDRLVVREGVSLGESAKPPQRAGAAAPLRDGEKQSNIVPPPLHFSLTLSKPSLCSFYSKYVFYIFVKSVMSLSLTREKKLFSSTTV